MEQLMKRLSPECINHIFGYTYSPQSPFLLHEIKEHEEKKQLFKMYFFQMKESLELIFYSYTIDNEQVLYYLFQAMESFIYNTYYFISQNRVKVKEFNKIKERLERINIKSYFASNKFVLQNGYRIYYRIWNLLTIQEITDIIFSNDYFLIMCWTLKTTSSPIPYSWMYIDETKQELKPEYKKMILEIGQANRIDNLEMYM